MASMLPPGIDFIPSEELLLDHYLTNKNKIESGNYDGDQLIRELNLLSYDAFGLPRDYSFTFGGEVKFRHWFCFTYKLAEDTIMCNTGFWRKKGIVRVITRDKGNEILGTKTIFCFYRGKNPRTGEKTNWIMYEYALPDNIVAPFVLCRIFKCEPGMDLSSDMKDISDRDEADIADEEVNKLPSCATDKEVDPRASNALCPQDTQQGRLAELPDDDALMNWIMNELGSWQSRRVIN